MGTQKRLDRAVGWNSWLRVIGSWLAVTVVWGMYRFWQPVGGEVQSELIAKPLIWVGLTYLLVLFKIIPSSVVLKLRKNFITLLPFWRVWAAPVVTIAGYHTLVMWRVINWIPVSASAWATEILINFATAGVEEWLYRGVLYLWLLNITDEWRAFGAVQVLFVLAHAPVLWLQFTDWPNTVVRIALLLIMSCVHTAIFRFNKSLVSSVLSHGVWNTLNHVLVR